MILSKNTTPAITLLTKHIKVQKSKKVTLLELIADNQLNFRDRVIMSFYQLQASCLG